MSKKAIVIGSGIAGIASAIRLINKGYEVEVFEKNAYLGGKLTEITLGSYRFDAGPSLFTLPHLVEELFTLSNKKTEDYFDYQRCEITCDYFYEDGISLSLYADRNKLLNEISSKLHIDTTPLQKHLERSKLIYNATYEAFLERSLHKVSSYFTNAIFRCITHIPWLNLFTTMHDANVSRLNHPKLVQLFDRYATYNGSNPYQAPGILNIIPHLELEIGSFFPTKGMHSITTSLVKLATELGVKFHTNAAVDEILSDQGKITGIRIQDKHYQSDVVVCNSDIKPAYRYLLPHSKKPTKILKQEPSSSALIFYWGIQHEFKQLDLHNIFFSEDYKHEFESIFQHNAISSDPTVYVNISSKKLPSDAPKGCENWFVMVNVPANNGQDWNKIRTEVRANVISKLSRLLGEDLASLIIEEDYLDPIRIEERTSSFAGALYGASSNDRNAAFFRHPNFSSIKGLHFVGGSVHPGGGIPLCLQSAKIAVEMVKKK
ncbi:MAG: phytoene desaturase [Crocinitomicaceae bacterium]|nr:phytoene desaturase [Crocinitomicaceae bacterium]